MLNDVLHILLGAALVSVGFLVAALAERIRGRRPAREVPAQRERTSASRVQPPTPLPAHQSPQSIPVVGPSDILRSGARRSRLGAETKASATTGGDDVIAALVASGYKKPVATEATWACSDTERATIEGWTAAALRRCARGGLS